MEADLPNDSPAPASGGTRSANPAVRFFGALGEATFRSLRNRPLLWSAVLILVLTRVWFTLLLGRMGPYGDEDNYVSRGVAFWEMVKLFFTGQPISEAVMDRFYYEGYWPPLFSIIIGPIHTLGSYPLTRLFLSGVDIATALVLWRIAERLLGQKGASIATLIYALNPFFLSAGFAVFAEGMYHFFMLLAVWQWLRLMDAPVERDRTFKVILGWVWLGLAMAAAILTRASFLPLLIALIIATAWLCLRRPRALAGMAGATVLMFALTMPWNAVIMAKEGRFMFLQTLSEAQMAMKFSDGPSVSWNTLWAELGQEAEAKGVTRADVAKERVDAYFEANRDKPGVVLNQVTEELVRSYMFGESQLEQRMRLGFYPDVAGRQLWYVMLWQEATRLALIVAGLAAILFPIGLFRRRGEMALMLASTVAIVLVGNVSGRHLTSALPFLVLGAAALAAWLASHPWRSQLWGWGAMAGFAVIGLAAWNAFPIERVWSASYRNGIEMLGREAEFVDLARIRRFAECGDKITLASVPEGARISISGPGIERKQVKAGDELAPGDVTIVEIVDFPAGTPLALPVFINRKPNMLRFDLGRSADWREIDDTTCLLMNE